MYLAVRRISKRGRRCDDEWRADQGVELKSWYLVTLESERGDPLAEIELSYELSGGIKLVPGYGHDYWYAFGYVLGDYNRHR